MLFICTFIFIIPTLTCTSFDFEIWDTIIPFWPRVFTKTSVLGFKSSTFNFSTEFEEKLAVSLVNEEFFILVFNLFLRFSKSLIFTFEFFISFICFIIEFESSLAFRNISLAFIFALSINSFSFCFNSILSFFRLFSRIDIFWSFKSISLRSFSIILLLSYIFFNNSSILIWSFDIRDFALFIISELSPKLLLISKALLFPGIPTNNLYVGIKVFISNSTEAFSNLFVTKA